MIGRSMMSCLPLGMFVGAIYLAIILWQVTGFTPMDLISAITDIVIEPLREVTEALK